MEFKEPTEPQTRLEPVYQMSGYEHHSDRTYTFALNSNDEIDKVVVWTDGRTPKGVRFHTRNGSVSQIYGLPEDGAESVEFGQGKGCRLVGIYGNFNFASLHSLGFTFLPISQ